MDHLKILISLQCWTTAAQSRIEEPNLTFMIYCDCFPLVSGRVFLTFKKEVTVTLIKRTHHQMCKNCRLKRKTFNLIPEELRLQAPNIMKMSLDITINVWTTTGLLWTSWKLELIKFKIHSRSLSKGKKQCCYSFGEIKILWKIKCPS